MSGVMKKVAVVGAPIETGQTRAGLKLGPDFIRGLDLLDKIRDLGYFVNDFGNINVSDNSEDQMIYNAKFPKTFSKNCVTVGVSVKKALIENDCVVLLGGDRTITTGSIIGHYSALGDICVIYVSSKPNLHTPLSLEKGNMNQMPLFLLIDSMQDEIPWINEFKHIYPILSANALGIIGIHDVDNYERYIINKCAIKATTTAEIDRLGIEAVIRETLMTVNPDKTKSIHLCFNCDALDPMFAPSTADSRQGGLTLREAIKISEVLFDTGNLKVIEISEVNPQLGSQKDNIITRSSIMQIILTALGTKRHGIPKIDSSYYDWKKTSLHRGARFMKL